MKLFVLGALRRDPTTRSVHRRETAVWAVLGTVDALDRFLLRWPVGSGLRLRRVGWPAVRYLTWPGSVGDGTMRVWR